MPQFLGWHRSRLGQALGSAAGLLSRRSIGVVLFGVTGKYVQRLAYMTLGERDDTAVDFVAVIQSGRQLLDLMPACFDLTAGRCLFDK